MSTEVSVEEGGTHRLDMSTSVWFRANDPKTGLSFRWSFDIEPHTANGKGHYKIDAAGCREVLAKLKGKARGDFRAYLADCSRKVQAKADEWKGYYERQARDAATLALLAAG